MRAFCFRASLAAVLLTAMSGVHAAPVSYSIAFGAGGNLSTPTGSFVYDSTLAVNQQFVSFTVTEQGAVFDFTSAANNFSFRTDAGTFHTACNTPNVNDAFELLTDAASVATAPGAGSREWQVITGGFFRFGANSGSPTATDSFAVTLSSPPFLYPDDGSSFLATPVALPPPSANVPEPASIALFAVGIDGLAIGRRKRWH
jgi:hypothetical protein